MAAIETPQSLKERKQVLLIESDLNRLVMQLELENLRSALTRTDTLVSRVGNYASWIMPALSVLGLFGGKRSAGSSISSGLSKIVLGALPLVLRFLRPKQPSD
jgi:hypothetical protein